MSSFITLKLKKDMQDKSWNVVHIDNLGYIQIETDELGFHKKLTYSPITDMLYNTENCDVTITELRILCEFLLQKNHFLTNDVISKINNGMYGVIDIDWDKYEDDE